MNKRGWDSDDDDDEGSYYEDSEDDFYRGGRRYGSDDDDDGEDDEDGEYLTVQTREKIIRPDRDDRPVTIVYANRQQDEGPYFPRYPAASRGELDPIFQGDDLPLGVTPDGYTVNDMIYNLRRAVQMNDSELVGRILLSFFNMFVYMNRPTTVLCAPLDRRTRLDMVQKIGPFCNVSALAVHQMIWWTVKSIFLEQVGMAVPTMILELEHLRKMYNKTLFIEPYASLACLLRVGQLLVHAPKSCAVLYMADCWADTAQDRKLREQIAQRLDVMALGMRRSHLEKINELLGADDVYYPVRDRDRRYMQKATQDHHPKYLRQVKMMTPKYLNAYIDSVMRDTHKLSDSERGLAQEILYLAREWCQMEYVQVNSLLGNRRAQRLQGRILLLVYLLEECLCRKEVILLDGTDDAIFKVSEAYVEGAPLKVQPDYARRLRQSRLPPLSLTFGLLGEDAGLAITGDRAKKKKKKTAALTTSLFDLMEKRAQVIPRTQEHLDPGAEINGDGFLVPARGVRPHPLMDEILGPHTRFYFVKRNWKRLLRQNVAPPLETWRRREDALLIDFEDNPTVIASSPHVDMMEVSLHRNAVHECFPHILEPLPTNDHKTNAYSLSCSYEAEHVTEVFNGEEGSVTRVRAVVIGPFPMSSYHELRERVEASDRAKARFHLSCRLSQVMPLVLHRFPVSVQRLLPGVQLGRQAVFVVHVPYQTAQPGFTLRAAQDWFKQQKGESYTRLIRETLHINRVLPVIPWMRTFVDPDSNLTIYQVTYVSFQVVNDKDGVRLANIRLSVIGDDLRQGALRKPTTSTSWSLETHLRQSTDNLQAALQRAPRTAGRDVHREIDLVMSEMVRLAGRET